MRDQKINNLNTDNRCITPIGVIQLFINHFMNALASVSLIFLIVLLSCHDRKNIIVAGQITDETTGQPILNAEVVILCWYMHNDEASFNKKNIKTDNKGNFKANFERGYQVDIASKATGYNPIRNYNKLSNNEINVNLKLSKAKNNPTLVSLLNTDNKSPNLFMRVRIYADKNGKTLDFNNSQTFGFDFSTMTITSDTMQCDLWFKIEKKEGQPTAIQTNGNSGVIPIFDQGVKSSLLYEKTIAPIKGYVTSYKLKGNEAGFFVLCRNDKTYGKLILDKSTIDISSPDGNGSYYKEFGKNISCFYQPNTTTDLTYSKTDVDLEDFLMDARM